MTTIQEELGHRILGNERFRSDLRTLVQHFLMTFWRLQNDGQPVEDVSWVKRLAESAVILASSADPTHKGLAYNIATMFQESRLEGFGGLSGLLKVVCARTGNIPALGMLNDPIANLPLTVEVETHASIASQTVSLLGREVTLTRFQYETYSILAAGVSTSVSAPTSAGKSFIVMQFVAQQLVANPDFVVAILVPTRSLIREFVLELQRILRDYQPDGSTHILYDVQILTSSIETPESANQGRKLFVLTQERLQSILYNWSQRPRFNLIVIDESQKIGDDKRGIILEETISDLASREQGTQFVFLSPISSNPGFLLELLGPSVGRQELHSTLSPVTQHVYSVAHRRGNRRLLEVHTVSQWMDNDLFVIPLDEPVPTSKARRLAFLARRLGANASNIIYANGPAEAERIATTLATLGDEEAQSDEVAETIEYLTTSIHEEYHLVTCLRRGVAYHYGSMPDIARISAEDLYRDNLIKNIVCTSTLLEGVNLPAKNIFVEEPRLGNMVMDDGTFWNLAGRAGRLLRDFSGNVFCVNSDRWERPVSTRQRNYRIESSLTKTLNTDGFIGYCEELSLESYTESYEQALNSLVLKLTDYGTEMTQRFLDQRVPSDRQSRILDAIQPLMASITLPADILRKNRAIDFRLQHQFLEHIMSLDPADLLELSPRHPLSQLGYQSVQDVFRVCDNFLVIGGRGQRYIYFTLIAHRWIREESLRDMIRATLRYQRETQLDVDVNRVIRELVDTLNSQVRYYYVRTTKCYCDLLRFEYARRGILENTYPQYVDFGLPNYLELGMSNAGTIQLHNLGLSRTTAVEVNRYCQARGVPTTSLLEWLRGRIGEVAAEMPRPIRYELAQVFAL